MRISFLFGLLSLLAVYSSPLAVASVPLDDFDQLIRQLRGALTKFDLDSARALLNKACHADTQPDMPPADISVGSATAKTAVCESEAGVIDEAARDGDDAEAHYLRALAIWTQLAPNYAASRATTLMDLGDLYRTQRRMAEAEKALTQAFALAHELANSESDPRLLASVTSRLGGFYSNAGAPEQARPLLQEAIAMLRRLTPPNPAELACALGGLGMLSLQSGDFKAAESSLREAVSVAEDNLGEDHPDTAAYESSLGLALYLEGQYDQAVVLLRRARYIVEARLPGSEKAGSTLAVLTLVETSLGRFGLAEADGKQLLGLASAKRDPDSLEIALAKVTLATVYLRERKFDDAAKILPDAIAVERRAADDPRMRDQRVLAYAILGLGQARAAQRNWTEAQSLYSEAIGIYEAKLGEGNPTIAPVLREYAQVLKHSGAPRKEVKRIEAKANAIKT